MSRCNISMFPQMYFLLLVLAFTINNGQATFVRRRNHTTYQLLKEAKERVKLGLNCLSPSKYFAGSCYTYVTTSPVSSWELAHNSCLSMPTVKNADLLTIESVKEYEFIERELIGLKSGSESVSVYIGLRKINNVWLWSNDIPLKSSPASRFWIDNHRDIIAYDCGILWLAKNTSVITPAPCVEQASRFFVCKQTIDRCYNRSGNCGKYGKCIDLPLMNSYKCQCRYFYTGDRCEKWSNQGIQVIIGCVIVVIALVLSYIINLDRSEDSWSFQKSFYDHHHATSRPTRIRQTSRKTNHAKHPPHLINSSTPMDKHEWSKLPTVHQTRQEEHTYSSYVKNIFIKQKRTIHIMLSLILTIVILLIVMNARNYIHRILNHAKQLYHFCTLYENNYYHNLLTLPIALVLIFFIVINQTRKEYRKSNTEKISIHIPMPYNPFSKINRFDTMVLCGIISYEILGIIEEIYFKTTQIQLLTMTGPLFDLIRQIGLIIIVGLRYYPVYTVIDGSNSSLLYSVLCSFYMWLDLILHMFEQVFCVNINPLIRIWKKMEQNQNRLNALVTTTAMSMSTYEDNHHSGVRGRFNKIKDELSFRGTKTLATTTVVSKVQPFALSESSPVPFHSINWSLIDVNSSMFVYHNDSHSVFDHLGIERSMVCVMKYALYYLCLTYVCIRLTYMVMVNIYNSFRSCNNANSSIRKPLKHIYHKPTYLIKEAPSIEYRYVRHLFQSSSENLLESSKEISIVKLLLHKIYRPHEYFRYSKQILNTYMIAFTLIYYLTFNILEHGFNLIEKLYGLTLIPLLVIYDELELPEPKAVNLKYEMILSCVITVIIYCLQLLFGLKTYQRHMLDAYKGIFIDIPPRSAFRNSRFISKNIHYPGYCIAYLVFGYIIICNVVFFLLIALNSLIKHVFLIEDLAKIVIPILVIYLTSFVIQWFLSRTFFLQRHGKSMVFKNLRVYFLFAYFNFFFDCFLGIISCAFRVSKAWLAHIVFLPRLDYSVVGRTLEKMDPGFISYASFIHVECLHTHPVLVYFCSIVTEQIHKRNKYLRTSKRDIYLYTKQQQITFRWCLAITLSRNPQFIQLRKYRFTHLNLSKIDSYDEFFERKLLKHFHSCKSIRKTQEQIESHTVIGNHGTTCTTLLLDVEEQNDRKPSF